MAKRGSSASTKSLFFRAKITFSPFSIFILLLLGIFHTGITYAMYFFCIQYIKTQTIAIFSYVDPIVAILLSALILHENIGLSGLIGTILILGSTLASEFIS
ncbi:DMT family transporter [Fusobacterium necrophorum]|nr:DMT family transporter [Fusobacterium necrophorum]